MTDPLHLDKPMHIRAEMARSELCPGQLHPWWSADTDRMVDPFDGPETRAAVKNFMGRLWKACLEAEANGSEKSAILFAPREHSSK